MNIYFKQTLQIKVIIIPILLIILSFSKASALQTTKATSTATSTDSNEIILTYHQVRDYTKDDSWYAKRFITTPAVFLKEMDYLSKSGYKVVPLNNLVNHIKSDLTNDKIAIITFDDGYASQYQNAFPILQKYKFTATFYIYTDAISHFPIAMTWEQLADLQSKGMEIGAHTMSHPTLTKIKDNKTILNEILGSKKILETKLNTKITTFAYPYGKYNDRLIKSVMDAGFTNAVSDDHGKEETKDNLFNMERFSKNENYGEFVKEF